MGREGRGNSGILSLRTRKTKNRESLRRETVLRHTSGRDGAHRRCQRYSAHVRSVSTGQPRDISPCSFSENGGRNAQSCGGHLPGAHTGLTAAVLDLSGTLACCFECALEAGAKVQREATSHCIPPVVSKSHQEHRPAYLSSLPVARECRPWTESACVTTASGINYTEWPARSSWG